MRNLQENLKHEKNKIELKKNEVNEEKRKLDDREKELNEDRKKLTKEKADFSLSHAIYDKAVDDYDSLNSDKIKLEKQREESSYLPQINNEQFEIKSCEDSYNTDYPDPRCE